MGQMVDGVWQPVDMRPDTNKGAFQRAGTVFRNHITPDGPFPPEPNRYRLYVSLACPWAHRTVIFRTLKKLEGLIDLSVTHWLMGDAGWSFEPGEAVIADPDGATAMHEIYRRADAHYTGRVTVPVLWDKRTGTIVSNESADIIRMFNSAFDPLGAAAGDYYPAPLRAEIDALNTRFYDTVNNGVYKAGFAQTQAAYDSAVASLFETLDWLETRLAQQRFLCGTTMTEADWRLFTTLIRFDSVYHGHFKCNIRRLVDYPALWAYTRALYHVPGVADTVNFMHIKRHYYMSHPWLNPTRIVPSGPLLDFS